LEPKIDQEINEIATLAVENNNVYSHFATSVKKESIMQTLQYGEEKGELCHTLYLNFIKTFS